MAPKKAKAQPTSVLGDVAPSRAWTTRRPRKITNTLDGFEPFDDAMREETRLRREKDARKIAAMKAEMSRLEGLLRDQVAITDSQQRSLQKHCDAELVKAYQAFAELLEHQDIEVHKRLDADKRADALEERFATEKARILEEIEAESQRCQNYWTSSRRCPRRRCGSGRLAKKSFWTDGPAREAHYPEL